MSKTTQKKDDGTMSILDYLSRTHYVKEPSEGKFNCIDRLRSAINAAIKACPLSRHQIAGEMSHLTGDAISKEMVDTWTRQSDEMNGRPGRHIPAEYLPAFCKATGDNTVIEIMGQMVGLFVLPAPEVIRAEINKIDEQIRVAQKNKKRRELLLMELERDGVPEVNESC